MSRRQVARGSGRRPAEIPLGEDLAALLSQDQAVYMQLGPEGAILSVKAPGAFAYGEAEGVRWHRMAPEERADLVTGWIRKAAAYSRRPRIRWGAPSARPPRPRPA